MYLQVAAASGDVDEVKQFAADLMNTNGGLADRTKYDFVEKVSWFSEFFFPGFNVTGHTVAENEQWSSSLFNPFGGLTPVGEFRVIHKFAVSSTSILPLHVRAQARAFSKIAQRSPLKQAYPINTFTAATWL